MRAVRITFAILGMTCLIRAAETQTNSAVSVALHDSHGLSPRSAPNGRLEIILFASHTHIHFKISNTTKQALKLWQPGCPEGDFAMTIEFREPSAPDKISRSGTGNDYTAGMGVPKVLTLAPDDDLMVNVDFLSRSGWNLPVALKAGESRELEVRAVYRPAPLTDQTTKRMFELKETEQVWTGVATSTWNKARIINRTGAPIEAKNNRDNR